MTRKYSCNCCGIALERDNVSNLKLDIPTKDSKETVKYTLCPSCSDETSKAMRDCWERVRNRDKPKKTPTRPDLGPSGRSARFAYEGPSPGVFTTLPIDWT